AYCRWLRGVETGSPVSVRAFVSVVRQLAYCCFLIENCFTKVERYGDIRACRWRVLEPKPVNYRRFPIEAYSCPSNDRTIRISWNTEPCSLRRIVCDDLRHTVYRNGMTVCKWT